MPPRKSWDTCTACLHNRGVHAEHGRGRCSRLVTMTATDTDGSLATTTGRCGCEAFTEREPLWHKP